MHGLKLPDPVRDLAVRHVAALRPVEGFVWRMSPGRRVAQGWYFDYLADRLPSNPPGPGSGFGFPPGFLVADDGTVRVVRMGELRAVLGLRG